MSHWRASRAKIQRTLRFVPHLPAFGCRRQERAETLALGAAQPHRGVVEQRRLVEGDVQAAVGAQGHRRVRLRDFHQRRALVQVLVTIPLGYEGEGCRDNRSWESRL